MIRVLCGELELQEYGEVVVIGDRVQRRAARRADVFYGGALDEIKWGFDRYAEHTGAEQAVVGGTVVGIEAVFVSLMRDPDGAWVPRLGSAHLEAIASTANTRRIQKTVEWDPYSESDNDGGSFRRGRPIVREGDERFSAWLLHLVDEQVSPVH